MHKCKPSWGQAGWVLVQHSLYAWYMQQIQLSIYYMYYKLNIEAYRALMQSHGLVTKAMLGQYAVQLQYSSSPEATPLSRTPMKPWQATMKLTKTLRSLYVAISWSLAYPAERRRAPSTLSPVTAETWEGPSLELATP